MNRFPTLFGLSSLSSSHHAASEIDHSVVTASRAVHFPHSIFAPIHYEKNYSYPLVVWLHGPESDERQMLRVMPLISMRNYVAVAPQAPWAADDAAGYDWRQCTSSTTQAAQLVFECIDLAKFEYNVAPSRVFLAGYGTGGEMALRIGLCHPRDFAGIISIGGPFPRGCNPLGNISAVRRVPLLIAQGRDSQIYPVEDLCEDLRLFHAGGMNVTVRHYTCGDVIHQRMLRDMDAWMMEQVTGASSNPPAEPYLPGAAEVN